MAQLAGDLGNWFQDICVQISTVISTGVQNVETAVVSDTDHSTVFGALILGATAYAMGAHRHG